MNWIEIENLEDVPNDELLWVSDGNRVELAELTELMGFPRNRWDKFQEPEVGEGIWYDRIRGVLIADFYALANLDFEPTHYQRLTRKPLPPC